MAQLAPVRPLVGFLVAAPASGSGKTVVTTGLVAALARRGLAVSPAKVGPDYIDTAFLSAAAGTPAVNLDLWAMRGGLFDRLAARPGLVVEGVMGLFDGPASGIGSSADVARRLGLPVILVVSAERMSHSVAALVHGFATFDPALRVAGAILTKVASERHEGMLREALARGGVACLGALRRDAALALPSRHLGLKQAREAADLATRIATIADRVEASCDMDAVAALLDGPSVTPAARPADAAAPLPPLAQSIAIASDDAFSFVYTHIMDGWRAAGAELSFFSPLAGEAPPPGSGAVFLPGGYPELFAGRLAATRAWADGLAARAAEGALIYGECGGYMALGEGLVDGEGERHEMAGLLPVTTSFTAPRRRLGYRVLSQAGGPLAAWPARLRGHEFHYAGVDTEGPPLFRAEDAAGVPLGPMGTTVGRVAGSFAHLIDAA
ncbi:MAG: cobyrinate a,c-diamide synthase [Acuticoccus sp.]